MHPSIERITLQIEKPEALRGLARGASVEITRARRVYEPARDANAGRLDELRLRTHEAELSLLSLAPGAEASGEQRQRIEWLVSGRLLAAESELVLGSARELSAGSLETLRNPEQEPAILFRCIARAPFTHDFSETP